MSHALGSKVRGTIIKIPDSSPGVVFVNSEQKPFGIEGIWRSPVAPAVNMTVDVDLDGSGAILALTAVDPKEIARERLEKYGEVAQEQGKQILDVVRQAIGALATRMGKVPLAATVVVWIAWFFMPAATLNFFTLSRSFTFWQLLAVDFSNPLNMGSGGHGLFALVGLAALAAPFLAPFVRHPQANYLHAVPLPYVVIAFFKIRLDLGEALEVISFSYGIYVLFLAGVVLAVHAARSRTKA